MPDFYPIRHVAALTGVKPITLRAWENRYNLLSPHRTSKGHRLYTQGDVELIQRLVALLNRGLAISQAISKLDNFEEFELVGEKNDTQLINLELLKRHLLDNKIGAAIDEVMQLFKFYSPGSFAQYIYPKIQQYLITNVWPQIESDIILHEMLLDGLKAQFYNIIQQKSYESKAKSVYVIGYLTGGIKPLILHGLFIANILHSHGIRVYFCSGVSSLESLAQLPPNDMVILFSKYDPFHTLHLIKYINKNQLSIHLSTLEVSELQDYETSLPLDFTKIYDYVSKHLK